MEIGSVKSALEALQNQNPSSNDKPVEAIKSQQTSEPANALEAAEQNKQKTEEDLKEAVDKLNKTAVIFDRSLRFQIHDKTHRTMVSVVDIVQDKVIRQIPNEEVLDLVAKMDDYLGMIFDKKA
ncbi:MAG TPA: flagellar protein FlaG [Candidatus Rifleibacterium sp.]|nr:flagellar protein FlaG [Candidatus Rifleibacterium sp.]HPT46140.1 flagellar protein FlaG [Candidatus Rifleibacterium sp.]